MSRTKYNIVGHYHVPAPRSWGICPVIEKKGKKYIKHVHSKMRCFSETVNNLVQAEPIEITDLDFDTMVKFRIAERYETPRVYRGDRPPVIVEIGQTWGEKRIAWAGWAIDPMMPGVIEYPDFNGDITGIGRKGRFLALTDEGVAFAQRDKWMRGARELVRSIDDYEDIQAMRICMFWTDSTHPAHHAVKA